MWRPTSGAFYPVNQNAVVTFKDYFGDKSHLTGTLTGYVKDPARTRVIPVLAWCKDINVANPTYILYIWNSGQQHRIGWVKASDIEGLDKA